jgi:hypothetical protein
MATGSGAYHSRGELLCSPIALLGHADGIDGYRVLSCSPDRHLVGSRKVILNFVPADRLIGRKLFLIGHPPVDAGKTSPAAGRSPLR